MKKLSISKRNSIILILTMVPFLIALLYSITQSDELDYFGTAINISGSQRMRTMLIANYSQQYVSAEYANDKVKSDAAREIIEKELLIYEKYMIALVDGDSSVNLVENKYDVITADIMDYKDLYSEYIYNANVLLDDYKNSSSLEFLIDHSMIVKNEINDTVNLFEDQNGIELSTQKLIDTIMMVVTIILTSMGLLFTKKIKKSEYYANYDFLTSLKNRHSVSEDIKVLSIKEYSGIFIDLVKFKDINDTFGHLVGDEILIEVARRIKKIFNGSDDYVYRFGGDEFLIFTKCKNSGSDVCKEDSYCESDIKELITSIKTPIKDSRGNIHRIGLSIGHVSKSAQSKSFSDLIKLSDNLMYDCKLTNANFVSCKDPILAQQHIDLSDELNSTLDNFKVNCFETKDSSKKSTKVSFSPYWNYNNSKHTLADYYPLIQRKGRLLEIDTMVLDFALNYIDNNIDTSVDNNEYLYIIHISQATIQNGQFNEFNTKIMSFIDYSSKIVIVPNILDFDNAELIQELKFLSSNKFFIGMNHESIENNKYSDLITPSNNPIKIVNVDNLINIGDIVSIDNSDSV